MNLRVQSRARVGRAAIRACDGISFVCLPRPRFPARIEVRAVPPASRQDSDRDIAEWSDYHPLSIDHCVGSPACFHALRPPRYQ